MEHFLEKVLHYEWPFPASQSGIKFVPEKMFTESLEQ
jgi:hypothetical protein